METIGQNNRRTKLLFTLLSFGLMLVVGLIDYATGYDVVVSLFYLIPISLAVWFTWGYAGISIAIMSGLIDIVANLIAKECFAHPVIVIWNSAIKVFFYLLFAHVLLKLEMVLEREEALSRTDPLTGLVNSRFFSEIGNVEIERALRYKHPLSIAYMDIDNFKKVNDTLGHSVGDAYLRSTAAIVKKAIRKTDTVARLGGDEFAILFTETGHEEAKTVINRIQKSLLFMASNFKIPVTFSIGIVTNMDQPCNFDSLIKAADSLMYSAKDGGKNMIKDSIMSCPRDNPAKQRGG